jgi:hypothetical protein
LLKDEVYLLDDVIKSSFLNTDPPSKWGGPPLEFIDIQPRNGGLPLKFINIKPLKMGSASKIHHHTAQKIRPIKFIDQKGIQPKRGSTYRDNFYGSSGT